MKSAPNGSKQRRPVLGKALERFAISVTARPWRTLTLALLLGGVALFATSRLRLESSYLALLPQNAPEVNAIETVRRYSGGTAELVIAVGGPEARRLPYARKVVDKLNSSGLVEWAEAELPTAFFRHHSLYFAKITDLERARALLSEQIAKAKRKANPLLIDLEDDDEDESAKAQGPSPLAQLRRELTARKAKLKRTRTTSDGRYLLISVKPRAAVSQLGEGKRVLGGIQRVLHDVRGPGEEKIEVRLAGSLVTNQEQNSRMASDLSSASLLALLLAIGLITVVSRRLSATLVVAIPLVLGVLSTLAVATVTIGHLNLVSGFLVAALVGLGVDFGIHLYLRYLDELALLSGDAPRAMRTAIVATFGPCLTAAITTSAAFLALIVADFRGFSEYGMIAAIGVMVTLLLTFVAMPPLALLIARYSRPRCDEHTRKRLRNTRQLSRPLAWAMVVGGFAFIALSGFKLRELSFYNNFKKLQGTSAQVAFDDYITHEVGGSLSPALLMVDDLASAKRAERVLRAHLQRRGEGSPIAKVASIASLLPRDLGQRTQLLEDLRRQLATVLAQSDDLSAADQRTLLDLHAATTAQPWTVAGVPRSFRQRLVARHGGKHFVLLWPRKALEDDRRIGAWAGELRLVMGKLERGGVKALLLDENLIAARVVELIRADGPRVLALAAGLVLLILILDFRRFDRVLLVGSSVVLGVTAMLGLMVLFDMRLNLFNAVVLPTVLGIGIDNAVHLMHAYQARGRGSVPLVVATSGRAALLSSATTAIGFGSSIIAHHLGIQQLGVLALIGVGTTFFASTVLLPSVLRLFEGDGATATDEEATAGGVVPAPAPRTSTALSGIQRSSL
jgi:predicted RND superfamily exporter protein